LRLQRLNREVLDSHKITNFAYDLEKNFKKYPQNSEIFGNIERSMIE
jgi:hypothetical protein